MTRTRLLQALLPLAWLAIMRPALAQNALIRNQVPGGGLATCWIDFNTQGVFTGNLYCQDIGPGTPPSNVQWSRDRSALLVAGRTQHIHGRTPGRPGRAICYRGYDRNGQFYTNTHCYRGYGGAG